MNVDFQPVALRARWVFPVTSPPIDGGLVTVGGGRILAVGENTSGSPPRELGDVALLPGLVNAHTHLEFSQLQQPLGQPGIAFADWIRSVIEWRRQAPSGGQHPAILAGLAESRAAGVAAIGEIATSDWPNELPGPPAEIAFVVFRELLGLSAERVTPLFELAVQHVGQASDLPHVAGLSPHAPYTVHPELLRRVCELSALRQVPVAMHLAETREELELLDSHSGSLVELLQSLSAWRPEVLPRGQRPRDYLRMLATAHRSLVVHGNYLDDDEIAFLAANRDRMSAIYCPRTHAYFRHEAYPLAKMLAAGVRVAIGTDSRASNPDLSLWSELQHISHHHPDVPPDMIVRMGSLSGAEALGLASELGSVEIGKSAKLAIVRLPSGSQPTLAAILGDPTSTVQPLLQ